MAVPSRVFVGMTVFGLIATLLTVPYAILVLSGLRPRALSPALSFEGANEPGFQLFVVVAAAMSVGLMVFSWRSLLHGARRDARRREARRRVTSEVKAYGHQQRPPRGPN